MQKLPKIHFWKERIDAQAWAFHAVRGWGDRPSNGVFMLVAQPAAGYLTWSERQAIQTELEVRLKQRERILLWWYGRNWRNHLCARIMSAGSPNKFFVVDDFERWA